MKQVLLICFLLVMNIFIADAQSLYMPRDVKQAMQKGTRSMDGKPGKNYWQNYGRYNITVTANPPDRTIQGTEAITYVNNSPDTLKLLVFKLILNSHAPGAARQFPASEDYLTSGVTIDKFTENGSVGEWKGSTSRTWQQVRLKNPLLPGDSVKLGVDWHYEVSKESGREGAIDTTTFYLAYFYPRVAVYDDYNGWDRNDFVESQEFYNDFNDYTFQVKVPKNYVVWATGNLLNPDEVLQPTFAQRLKTSMTSDSVIHIATIDDINNKNITAQNEQNTWRWKADYVSDVAINISNHYVWDGGSVMVDDATRRRASVQAAYDNAAQDFHQMVEFGKHALDWLSHNYPGVPYPYPKTTIVQGFADMEYPMMVNDNTTGNPIFSRFVAEHEIAHSWFPFYMGINENRYGFMDEGWATTFEYLIGQADLGEEMAEKFFQQFRVNGWINDPSMEEDIPIITPANILSGAALGNNEYGKAALGYLAVKDLLGDAEFKKCLHAFMDRWHGKHPIPWDFFYTFNDVSGKNLNWFWHNWFFTNHYIDLAIQDVKTSSKGATLTLQNIGGFVAPVDVVVQYEDGSSETFHQTPGIWMNNQAQATVQIATKKKIQSISLDGGIFMDADMTNNSWKGAKP